MQPQSLELPQHLDTLPNIRTGINTLAVETEAKTSISQPPQNNLIRLSVSTAFENEANAYGLVDTGSTHSFIQLKSLPLSEPN